MSDDLANLTKDKLVALVRSDAFSAFKVGAFDIDGILRGKYMHRDKLLSSLENGFGFCDVVLGWDSADQLYDNVAYTGWHTGYPDAPVRLAPETARRIPFEPGTLFVLGEFAFFVFDETPDSIRAKGYRDLKPLTPGAFGYSVLRNSVHAELHHELMDLCEAMRMPLEGLHTETGAGVLEAALIVDSGLEAADRAALFKTFTKVMAQRRGLIATFMAKWSTDWPGQSGHIHVSLTDRDGAPVFHDAAAPHGMSDTMRYFLGGQQRLMPELLAMIASTVNSFTRLVPGFWAPTSATWGVENRTTALRVIGG